MSYDAAAISSGLQRMKSKPGCFSPLRRMTLDPMARPIGRPSTDPLEPAVDLDGVRHAVGVGRRGVAGPEVERAR